MRKTFALLAIFLIIFVVACAPPQAQQPAQAPPQAAPAQNASAPQAPAIDKPLVGADTLRTPNAQTEQLLARSGQVKSVSFVPAALPGKTGKDTYYVVGNRTKVKLSAYRTMNGWSADTVYADLAARTANAYCINPSVCKGEQKGVVDFSQYDVPTPQSWLDDIRYGEKTGSLQFEGRPVVVVRWEKDGKYYEAYLDSYFGIPHRVAIATDADMQRIVGGYEYQTLAINSATADDVKAPY